MEVERRPMYPKRGELLDCIGGPRDGDQLPIGISREVYIWLDPPMSVLSWNPADYPPSTPLIRKGVYEVSLFGRGHGKGKPVDWFYALKWMGEW